ncbi:MAG: tryptophan 7-halogenase [Polyangiaceae bacterium]|nr:tryptophan 7-halogenase [Polyangiaceae bacterium]
MEQSGPAADGRPLRIGVIGGGTAGYFAALAIKRRFPHIDVMIVESSRIPIIGVGEATTTLMPPFLHAQLGLDIVELFHEVKPTFKLGIQFDWGLPGDYYFTYPFGEAQPVEAHVFERDLRLQSLTSLLMGERRAPILRGPENELHSLLPSLKFAYHLDNAPFVAFLAKSARRMGIDHVDVAIDHVVTSGEGRIEALRSNDGRELQFDLYVDATGFRSLLLERSLGSPFQSYASSLFCDTAIVATVPQRDSIQPYTTAETMDCGWCWRIPVEGEDHRGYVHSSAFIDVDAAMAEMRAKNPGMGEPWVVRFRSGRHREFWRKNVVAVGNAYGFVEPLESTALHMVIIEVAYLLAGIEAMQDPNNDESFAARANDAVGAHWDYLRWFLSVHYKFNRRLDTPFWRASRADVDVSGVRHLLDRFEREGPWVVKQGQRFEVGDPAFGYSGLMMMLLGQRVPCPEPVVTMSREAWQLQLAKYRGLVQRALPQDEALRALREHPEMLVRLTRAPGSWCASDAERFSVANAMKSSSG